jgi:ABC-type phosphate/phosphonate transport system substrate-binding protein
VPLATLISREIKYPISFNLVRGESADDLFELGKQIDEGAVHIAIVWGMEYGWLRQRYPRIEPMAVTRHHTESLRSQLMVHPDCALVGFEDLEGAKLATYKRMPLMDQAYLCRLAKNQEKAVRSYFSKIIQCPTARDAIVAVREQQADCVMINTMVYNRHIADRPELKLRDAALSPPFPQTVLVGRPDRIDSLRPGLWKDAQDCLETVHRTAEGRQCMLFWRQERFIRPDADQFEQLVRMRVGQFPITGLKPLEPTDPP